MESGEEEPSPEAYRDALRQVIRRCIYAVDKNALAVDLCKVALWMEGHNAGLPLSFLDQHIRHGDSLVGVYDLDVLSDGIPDDAFKALTSDDKEVAKGLRKRNKEERVGQLRLDHAPPPKQSDLARDFAVLAETDDQTPADVHEKGAVVRQAARAGNRIHDHADCRRPLDLRVLCPSPVWQGGADDCRRTQGGEPAQRRSRPPHRSSSGEVHHTPFLPLAPGVPRGLRGRGLRRGLGQSHPGSRANAAGDQEFFGAQKGRTRLRQASNKARAARRLIKPACPRRTRACWQRVWRPVPATTLSPEAAVRSHASGRFVLGWPWAKINTYPLFADLRPTCWQFRDEDALASSSRQASPPMTARHAFYSEDIVMRTVNSLVSLYGL